jgi:hypothetical protein
VSKKIEARLLVRSKISPAGGFFIFWGNTYVVDLGGTQQTDDIYLVFIPSSSGISMGFRKKHQDCRFPFCSTHFAPLISNEKFKVKDF